MTRAEDLLALTDRVEKAEGAHRELDALIAIAVRIVPAFAPWAIKFPDWRVGSSFGRARAEVWSDDELVGHWSEFQSFTASLDAAMSLIGPDAYWRLGNDGEGPDVSAFKATVTSGFGPSLVFHDAVAATPALALLAATLRARARALSTEQQS